MFFQGKKERDVESPKAHYSTPLMRAEVDSQALLISPILGNNGSYFL
jgi:hypothetical protein